ncbi:hypothetical protein [Thalassospira marina]|uniref:Uncharacterized protein n=1 Tax=Thalassospira marina TaxID=2048283 RepID=A0A2N3KYU9_9PROT|nr:hypothetical protein [Thalassospira marina]PKR55745.1 hypothetical protein COO20_00530 [Thalassospira marina]
MWWFLGKFLARYYRSLALLAAGGSAAVIYGLVEQSPRAELAAWYWPPLCAMLAFVFTRLIIRRLLGQLSGIILGRLRF